MGRTKKVAIICLALIGSALVVIGTFHTLPWLFTVMGVSDDGGHIRVGVVAFVGTIVFSRTLKSALKFCGFFVK